MVNISENTITLISVIIILIVVDAKSKHNEISSDQVKEGLRLGIVRLGKAGGKVALCDDGDVDVGDDGGGEERWLIVKRGIRIMNKFPPWP